MVFKMTSLQDSELLAIINDILDCGKFANNTYPQPLNFHASEHARIRNHKHLEMQSCLDCSKLAQTCGKLMTSMPQTSILVWVVTINPLCILLYNFSRCPAHFQPKIQ